jgi:glycosyltransferase involved in cell wall biosynthesis
MSLHVAILDEEFPFPLTSGKRIRSFNLLSRLAKRHRITYLAHRNPDPEEQRLAERALREVGIRPYVVNYSIPPKSGIGFYGRLARNIFSSLPFSVATHSSREMAREIDELQLLDPPDLWHCEWTPYAQAMRGRKLPWIVMAHNVEALIWKRFTETETHPAKRWLMRQQWKKFEAFEKWAYSTSLVSIAVSAEDARLMEVQVERDVQVVDNGVDSTYFRPDPTVPRDPRRLLFLGSLDWRPNLDAVRLLLEEIFPQVLQREPRAHLDIVGRHPPDWLKELAARTTGVELHANVPDVRPYLHRAGLLVVPLRIGGGSRLKILEALAAGVPVLTSTVGVEGLRLESGLHCTIADETEAWIHNILRMMQNSQEGRTQAERGRRVVLDEYEWSGLAEEMERIWFEAASIPGADCPQDEFPKEIGKVFLRDST